MGRYKLKSLFGSLYAFLKYPEKIPPFCKNKVPGSIKPRNRAQT